MKQTVPMCPARRKRPRVALLVHTANEWIRQVLRGIAGYAHEQGEWDFYLEPAGLDQPIRIPTEWKANGIITRVTSPSWERAICKTRLPAVNVSWRGTHSPEIPKVVSDEMACATETAQHFLDRGFRHFGYVGPINRPGYDDKLGDQYVKALVDRGFDCSSLQQPQDPQTQLHLSRERLQRWISGLAKPVALFVWSSDIAREVTFICHAADIDVPTDVAILCVEFDSVMSSLAPVPHSNLDQAGTQVGYQAARLLHQLMEGGEPPAVPVLIPPRGIVQRQSTDTTAVTDQLVAAAARYVTENVSRPINVKHICDHLEVSRRNLETRFITALGRTPSAEIRRARIERAKRLLVETDLPLKAVAKQAGYNHTEVMIRNFSKNLGVSPGEFRRSH